MTKGSLLTRRHVRGLAWGPARYGGVCVSV